MRTNLWKKTLALALCAVLALTALLPAFAAAPFDDDAYASILTGSDFQDLGTKAYDRFGRLLRRMQADGLETPDSMLVGGDYTKILFDDAVPGMTQIGATLTEVYPDADPDAVICIQGNHDNPSAGFTKTGFYDMGVYCLYVINEDDYPWLQVIRPLAGLRVQALANDLKAALDGMIEDGDLRPVIVMTHLPLHHTSRALYADNRYASYLFNVLNAAGQTLDVIFLFGHQHSDDYDDYIGGSVNFMQPGDTIRVPAPDKTGEDAYTTETLTFTYTNCGYVGYANNNATETSTNVLTLGVIRLSENSFRLVKYTEDGVFRTDDVARKNPGAGADMTREGGSTRTNETLWRYATIIFKWFFDYFKLIVKFFTL